MGLSHRLGNFLILVGLLSLLVFAADFFTSGRIDHFEPLAVAVITLWLGAKLRARRGVAPPAPPASPPAPKAGAAKPAPVKSNKLKK